MLKSLVKRHLKSDFKSRLYAYIKGAIPFVFPEPSFYYLNHNGEVNINTNPISNFFEYRYYIKKLNDKFDVDKLKFVFDNLGDEYSKEIYLHVICYHLFEETKIRMPIHYDQYISDLQRYDYLIYDDTKIDVPQGTLYKWDLKPLGYNLKMIYGNKLGFHIQFIREQYKYRWNDFVDAGDVIIDGGACYGDTALYYADKAKGDCKVYAFEFMEENLEIFNQNLDLNPQYKDCIEIVKRPLHSNSDKTLYAIYDASRSYIQEQKIDGAVELQSISIDDFVEQNHLEKVDLIKLDVEGCEMDVLNGAEKTIRKFKPKLELCLYHKTSDLWEIPTFVKELVPEYNLWVNHNTLCTAETVLFASVNGMPRKKVSL